MSVTGLQFIIIFLSGSGFWFIFITSSIHDNYNDICFLDRVQCVFGKTLEDSNPDRNSSFSADENEEKLGKDIGKCYLNPLCFKLEDPQNASR
ncbi:MAG: hypothetical protein ACRD8Z_19595 [Nitrososphaeraceae archaeon]